MKTKYLVWIVLSMATVMQSCFPKDDEMNEVSADIIPGVFKVDIPASISAAESSKSAVFKSEGDTVLAGDTIYKHLRNFIYLGEQAGELVESIMLFLKQYEINRPMSLTYEDDHDNNRTKKLEVVEGGSYKHTTYAYTMTITTLDNVTSDTQDGGKGLQVFWSNNPVRGIAILKPYNINKAENMLSSEVKFSVAYSEQKTAKYDRTMEVKVSGYPAYPRYGLNTLWMFVGEKGDYVDVYGNSNHPHADFFQQHNADSAAFNWAFVASAIKSANIGVAEVGLPPSSIDSEERKRLLEDYSIKQTYERILREVYFDHYEDAQYDTEIKPYVDDYLVNTEAPGYFSGLGFFVAGVAPNNQYNVLVDRINLLVPFSPFTVAELVVDFE